VSPSANIINGLESNIAAASDNVCPKELVRIGDVLDKLEKDGLPEVVPIFVTVDPNRDTIAQMLEYKKDFHPAFKMLTGTRAQIADITKAYRVYSLKPTKTMTTMTTTLLITRLSCILLAQIVNSSTFSRSRHESKTLSRKSNPTSDQQS
jgi:cytochrome oxidase Cu insertion factor (SCO1/SenC/PrrC family)